jgi:MFS family permease
MRFTTRINQSLRAAAAGMPRPFWFIWAGVFVTRTGSFVLPFLALYLTEALHLSLSQAGLMVALYGAGGAAAGPLGGFLADRIGRRVTMVMALGLGGTGMIALALVRRVEVLAPAIFLEALVTEMYRPAMQAAVADLVRPSDRVRAFGLVYWVINVGFAIGLTLGGLLASRSFFWLFVGDGATTLVFATLIWMGVPETRPAPAPRGHGAPGAHPLAGFLAPFRERPFLLFLGLSFLFALVFMQNATTFPLDMIAHGMTKAIFGRVLALNGLIIVLVQPFLGPFLARRDRSRTLAVGAVLVGVGFGLNALARTVPWYVLGVATWTVGEMWVLPVANAVVADLAPPDIRGRYQGAYSLSFGLAVCAAPALGMFVLERLGSVALWSSCLGIGLGVAAGQLALAPALARMRRARMAASPSNDRR